MNKATSLYLDLVRFGAAVAVVLTHLSADTFGGGTIALLGHEGDAAVTVFFVLSGFVIAHVLSTRENTLAVFAASRFARLYSIILPGIAIVALCDHFGAARDPALYLGQTAAGHLVSDSPERWVASALFLNRIWLINGGRGFEFGTDVPLWSLSYEVAYYVAIAILVFARGWTKVALLIALCLVVGPDIVLLAPLWLLGFGLYHLKPELIRGTALANVLWIVGLIVCLTAFRIRDIDFRHAVPALWRLHIDLGLLTSRYFAAGGFALSLAGYRRSRLGAAALAKCEAPIRWLGVLSFPLYVLHRPLLFLLFAFTPWRDNAALNLMWLSGGVFIVVAAIGPWLDATKPFYRAFFLSLFKIIGARRSAEA